MKWPRWHWPLWVALLGVALVALGLWAYLLKQRAEVARRYAEWHQSRLKAANWALVYWSDQTQRRDEAARRDGPRYPEGHTLHHWAEYSRQAAEEARKKLATLKEGVTYHTRMSRKWERAAARPWESVEPDPRDVSYDLPTAPPSDLISHDRYRK